MRLLVSTAILPLLAGFVADRSEAAPDHYACTIERAYTLSASGLRTSRRVLAALTTRSFEIDRNTGVVTGTHLENRDSEPTVVARGDSENSFQAYWIVRGLVGSRVRFIEVQEFAESPRKPFRAVVQNWTYTGFCE